VIFKYSDLLQYLLKSLYWKINRRIPVWTTSSRRINCHERKDW